MSATRQIKPIIILIVTYTHDNIKQKPVQTDIWEFIQTINTSKKSANIEKVAKISESLLGIFVKFFEKKQKLQIQNF